MTNPTKYPSMLAALEKRVAQLELEVQNALEALINTQNGLAILIDRALPVVEQHEMREQVHADLVKKGVIAR